MPARAELVFELEVDMTKHVFEGPLGEFTGYYTPGSSKPIARIKAITHRNNAYFQALLTGDPDIDVRNPDHVEWAITFRIQPTRDVIIIDGLPGGTLDPSLDGSLPLGRRVGSAMAIDATFPYELTNRRPPTFRPARHAARRFVEQGHEFFKVADVPGWQDYDFP
jgi:3-polyprenyl-4-hydroxybenzoate decarboxylase